MIRIDGDMWFALGIALAVGYAYVTGEPTFSVINIGWAAVGWCVGRIAGMLMRSEFWMRRKV